MGQPAMVVVIVIEVARSLLRNGWKRPLRTTHGCCCAGSVHLPGMTLILLLGFRRRWILRTSP